MKIKKIKNLPLKLSEISSNNNLKLNKQNNNLSGAVNNYICNEEKIKEISQINEKDIFTK
jgi:hypothetical protein